MITKGKKVQAVVLDWAGTTIDYGCRAPLAVFLELFKQKGIQISVEEASKPMGKLKIEHIRELLFNDRIKSEFIKLYKRAPSEETVKEFNSEFEKALFKLLPSYTNPLPRVLETVEKLRDSGLKIGYTKEMMEIIAPIVELKGYKPDYLITSSDVSAGRPLPWMLYQNAIKLGVFPMSNIIKVGDTIVDIKEGNNANCWSVGIIEGSSLMELTEEEFNKSDKSIINEKKLKIKQIYMENGADLVINSFADLPEAVEIINNMLNNNQYPGNKIELLHKSNKLFSPGHFSTNPNVKFSMMTDWGSRDSDYLELVQNIRKELVNLATFKNRDKYSTIIMQGSGSFSLESCIGGAIPKDGKLLILINGSHGKRMSKIAKVLNIDTVELNFDETTVPQIDAIEDILLKDKSISHVGFVHLETNSGILNPINIINKVIKKYNKISIVDAMSSFGAIPIDADEIGIDYMISCSNKCFDCVPGISFIIAKKDELDRSKGNKSKSLSLDMHLQYEYHEKCNGGSRFTSPVNVIIAFDQAIKELIQEGGIEQRYKRYCLLNKRLLEGMKEMKFNKLDLKGFECPIISTFLKPKCPKFDLIKFFNKLKLLNCIIYPGKLAEIESFRIATIGSIAVDDIEYLLSCVKQSIFWDNNL